MSKHNIPSVRINPEEFRDIAGDAWRQHAEPLADWFDEHLVNRRDCFGHYIAVEDRKDPDRTAITDKGDLTLAVLRRHFEGNSTGDLVGLHSTAIDEAQGEGEAEAVRHDRRRRDIRVCLSDLVRHLASRDDAKK